MMIEGKLFFMEARERLERLAQCKEGHDVRHYDGWLSRLEEAYKEITRLDKQLAVACKIEGNDKESFDWSVLSKIDILERALEDIAEIAHNYAVNLRTGGDIEAIARQALREVGKEPK